MLVMNDTISISSIDGLQNTFCGLFSFTPSLESLYRDETNSENRKSIGLQWACGFCLYHLFLLSDYLVLRNDFTLSFCLHILFLSPIYIVAFITMLQNPKLYDLMNCFAPSLCLYTELFQLFHGSGYARLYYLSGLAIVPMFFYVLCRPALRYALVSTALQCGVYLGVVIGTDILDSDGKLITALFGIGGGVITALTTFSMETASRRSFLLRLRVRLMNDQLETMSRIDPLTGLGNRRLLDDVTAKYWAESSREPSPASMIMIDVDKFKLFNDSYGHSAGDACLATIGRCVAGQTRNLTDTAVRFGGEEIVIFLARTDFEHARAIAEKVREAIIGAAIPHPALGQGVLVSASLGVATVSTAEDMPTDLVIRADKALYEAKNRGRNRVWPPVAAVKAARQAPSSSPDPAASDMVRMALS